jgi:hypothetical protein
MIRRVLLQRNAHKTPQRQGIRQPPGDAALRPDALEISDQQRTKVDPRRQPGPSVLGRIELREPLLDKLVKAFAFQQLIQSLVKGMPRCGCQLGVRDPQSLLLLPLLARAHRHSAILRTIPVYPSDVLAYESKLAPRAAREFREILRIRRTEFIWALVAFAGVMLLGTLKGIIVAIIVSLIALAYQVADPPVYVLARRPGTNVFRPKSKEHPVDETFPGGRL